MTPSALFSVTLWWRLYGAWQGVVWSLTTSFFVWLLIIPGSAIMHAIHEAMPSHLFDLLFIFSYCAIIGLIVAFVYRHMTPRAAKASTALS